MINYRSELVKMLKYLRKIKWYKNRLKRPAFKSTYLCSNGQDAEAIYLRDELMVAELKEFLKDIPDSLTVHAFDDLDYDGCSDGVLLQFEYERKSDDEKYYRIIKCWYESELVKEKAKSTPIPTEAEYYEMLAKINLYNESKHNFRSC